MIAGTDATDLPKSENVVRLADNPGKAYAATIDKDFEHSQPESQHEFFESLKGGDAVAIKASNQIATSIARTSDGHLNCFFANFAGLRGGENPMQTPQEGVQVTMSAKSGAKGFFLPFMGDVRPVKGEQQGDSLTFTLPTITRGAVFWVEP